MPTTDQDEIHPATAEAKAIACGRFNRYEVNVLNGVANWLMSRSNTVWAERFGYGRLMQSWSGDVREILGGYAEGSPPPEVSSSNANREVKDRALELASEWLRSRKSIVDGGTLAFMVEFGQFVLERNAQQWSAEVPE